MGETKKEPLGISKLLPPLAVERLTNAALEARMWREGSLKREKVIDEAIKDVRKRYPHFFREDDLRIYRG